METVVNIPMRGALPKLEILPKEMSVENAVRIEIEDGVPVFKASATVQNRIETLITKQHRSQINAEEELELDRYEEIDDYLSFLNRVVRNLMFAENRGE